MSMPPERSITPRYRRGLKATEDEEDAPPPLVGGSKLYLTYDGRGNTAMMPTHRSPATKGNVRAGAPQVGPAANALGKGLAAMRAESLRPVSENTTKLDIGQENAGPSPRVQRPMSLRRKRRRRRHCS